MRAAGNARAATKGIPAPIVVRPRRLRRARDSHLTWLPSGSWNNSRVTKHPGPSAELRFQPAGSRR